MLWFCNFFSIDISKAFINSKLKKSNTLLHTSLRTLVVNQYQQQLFGFTILDFAFTEAIALFALMMAFLILFVF